MKNKFVKLFAAQFLALTLLLPFAANAAAPEGNIVDVATSINGPGGVAEGEFDTLLAAVLVADPAVLERLQGNGRTTLFAPNDAAFEKLGLTAANIGTLDQDTLTNILLYHTTQARRPASDVLARDRLFMIFPAFLQQSGGVFTDTQGRTSNIILTDVEASNGIIHVIDTVVLPFAI